MLYHGEGIPLKGLVKGGLVRGGVHVCISGPPFQTAFVAREDYFDTPEPVCPKTAALLFSFYVCIFVCTLICICVVTCIRKK